MIGYIYKTTNLKNGKIYIGKHQAKVFEPDKYIGSGKLITEAINKYGKTNFKNELICWCETLEDLNKSEIYWISYYNSTDLAVGYNISYGGDGVSMTDEIKTRISNTLTSKNLKCYNNGKRNKYFSDTDAIPDEFVLGRILVNVSDDEWKLHASIASSNAIRQPRTDETKKKLHEAKIGEKTYNNGSIEIRLHETDVIPDGFVRGQLMTIARKDNLNKLFAGRDESNKKRKDLPEEIRKEKFGKCNLGKMPTNAKKVICIETKEIFNSIAEVTRKYSISQYKLQTAIVNKTLLNNYHWAYLSDYSASISY